jgi:hypothetical protein
MPQASHWSFFIKRRNYMINVELNNMTLEEINALLMAIKARIEELTPCIPRNIFKAEVRESHNQQKYEGFSISDATKAKDFDDIHYIEFLEQNSELSDEDVENIDDLVNDEKIEFLEEIYIKQNS